MQHYNNNVIKNNNNNNNSTDAPRAEWPCDPMQLCFPCAQPFCSQLTAQLLPTLVLSITAAVQPHAAVMTSNDFVAVGLKLGQKMMR